jgi:hypothetical protein
VEDHVTLADQAIEHDLAGDVVDGELEAGAIDEVLDILKLAGR